ncbi:hypothetical protein N7539_009285 [Penicillium diatomitis]|uniref:Uncharacterized protein n=1 Tax=Penicillium diatomitis TaxID=2819901 RepID=A0A9W9WM10_9EURO|nr:uncharacterized protein N7539_009285 [Penicillium diatomitis]KAJ5469667.1 hypothetical protein N7539_009285 [Penicillium diatomitis]
MASLPSTIIVDQRSKLVTCNPMRWVCSCSTVVRIHLRSAFTNEVDVEWMEFTQQLTILGLLLSLSNDDAVREVTSEDTPHGLNSINWVQTFFTLCKDSYLAPHLATSAISLVDGKTGLGQAAGAVLGQYQSFN